MAFDNGQLIVAGLSNEEFASKLRSVKYPFSAIDPGTSVEIYHGNHGAVETRSPVYAFVPYTVGGASADRRRLPVHAARHLPDGEPDVGGARHEGARHDDRRARHAATARST